uniref:Uncharacterized protein n=1 Tax=Nelumbo nucifera TaxID=4432 RepID=A0A822XEW1_NELNU|nr:TPA_asm: hypothetical protein HUJ06_020332 [Nelumbo nucifera]
MNLRENPCTCACPEEDEMELLLCSQKQTVLPNLLTNLAYTRRMELLLCLISSKKSPRYDRWNA